MSINDAVKSSLSRGFLPIAPGRKFSTKFWGWNGTRVGFRNHRVSMGFIIGENRSEEIQSFESKVEKN